MNERQRRSPGTKRVRPVSVVLLIAMASLVGLGWMLVAVGPASAHGAATRPGSRTYLCRIDGTHSTGDIHPNNPACADAVAMGGKQPLWDWFGVLRGDGAGRTRGFIPDGQLCSGGEPKYAGYDQARADWPYTSLTAGADLTIRYNAWAAHPGEFRLYVTRDGFDPTEPLRWDDLEAEPFSVWNQTEPNGRDEANGSPDYQWSVRLPQKSGSHIIYSIWTRSDSNETFYGCSDVRFDGGSGQVLGLGPGAEPIGPPPEGPAPTAPPSTTTTPPPPAPSSTPTTSTMSSTSSTSSALAPSSTLTPSSTTGPPSTSTAPGALAPFTTSSSTAVSAVNVSASPVEDEIALGQPVGSSSSSSGSLDALALVVAVLVGTAIGSGATVTLGEIGSQRRG